MHALVLRVKHMAHGACRGAQQGVAEEVGGRPERVAECAESHLGAYNKMKENGAVRFFQKEMSITGAGGNGGVSGGRAASLGP